MNGRLTATRHSISISSAPGLDTLLPSLSAQAGLELVSDCIVSNTDRSRLTHRRRSQRAAVLHSASGLHLAQSTANCTSVNALSVLLGLPGGSDLLMRALEAKA